jgi:hypothetical protein
MKVLLGRPALTYLSWLFLYLDLMNYINQYQPILNNENRSLSLVGRAW